MPRKNKSQGKAFFFAKKKQKTLTPVADPAIRYSSRRAWVRQAGPSQVQWAIGMLAGTSLAACG
jgi:hypothetical protein